MPYADLKLLFDKLDRPPKTRGKGVAVSALPIPGFTSHRIGKTADGVPALLISTSKSQIGRYAIHLTNLTVEPNTACRVWNGSVLVEESLFTVVTCPADDLMIREYFLRIGGPFVDVLGDQPTERELVHLIDSLVKLFQALAEPPRKSIQGLWAELFLIARAMDPQSLLATWHVALDERYDFSAGTQRIEVKSASGRTRAHHFSLEQLAPPAGTELLIASVCMERSGGGTTISDLLAMIRKAVYANSPALMRLEMVVGATLGEFFKQALQEGFDFELATESLQFYDSTTVPRPSGPLPPGVSQVRFVADLSSIPNLESRELAAKAGLFSLVLPLNRQS